MCVNLHTLFYVKKMKEKICHDLKGCYNTLLGMFVDYNFNTILNFFIFFQKKCLNYIDFSLFFKKLN